MSVFIVMLLYLVIYLIGKHRLDNRMENYDMSKVDNQKLFEDVLNKKTEYEIETKLTMGQYDKEK